MIRLLKLRNTNIQPLRSVSFAHTPLINERTCNLCNQIHNASKTQVVFQSTHTSPNIAPNKPRKKRVNKKNYTDMLIVKDSSASEVKARIKNLKPSDVKMLAMTNVKLNEIYKLKEFLRSNNASTSVMEYSYNNLTDFSNIPLQEEVVSVPLEHVEQVETEEVPKQLENDIEEEMEAVIERTDALLHNVKTIPFQPEIVEEEISEETPDIVEQILIANKQKRVKYTGDRRAREEVIARTLAAYIEVCAGLKNPHRGLNAFTFYRHRCKLGKNQSDRYPPINNVNVYNALLKGFAAKGDFRRLQDILSLVKEENIKLNVQSYAAIFECIARINFNDSHTRFIRMYTKEALANDITFDRILNEATFLYDQREKVIDAMQTHDINYKPNYWQPSVHYTNGLLNELNHEEQTKGLQEHKPLKGESGIFSKEVLKEWTQKQIDIEKNVMVTIKSIEGKPEPSEEVLRNRELWTEHIKLWESAAGEAFNRDLSALTAQRSPLNYDLYMRSIPMKDIITIIVDEAQKIAQGSETYSPTTTMLYKDLGSKVYARFKVLKKQKTGVLDKIIKVHTKYVEDYAESHRMLGALPDDLVLLNTRQKWQWAEHSFKHEGATIQMDHQEWTPAALLTIGKFLYNIIMHDLKIDVNSLRQNSKHKNYLPAFYTIFRTQGRAIKEEVKPHPVLSKLYRASVPVTLTFPAYELPMRCPPVPWTSVTNGGYLIAPCEVVRLPSQATAQKQRMRDAVPNQLFPTLDSLNQLSSVPWMVNTRILDVIMEVFRNGGSAKLDVPELPSSLPPPSATVTDMTKTQKHALFRQRLQYRRKKAEMYSLWCDCLYRLSLANHFRDDVFWLPHNMDFRGRVYPIPPHLNHLGSDLARSMLVFAESRPLGPNGLDWLKLHLVNLTGLKKRDPVSVRLEFADSILDDILDSADKPLDGRRWWAESEEPWQTLACCMEIAAAVRSPNPEEYKSHFPVHQDGSCNGLQHYAALGRDTAGAFSVNLSPARVPQDVYSAVVVLVEERRQKDAENGLEIAKVLEGFVKRKVIKQTVMTTVYGVTRFGARLQIARQLKDIDDFPKEFVWAGSNYLTARTFDSLRTMFTSTREIQDWFTECARLISSVCAENVEWVTPLGLPVVQPYLRYKKLGIGYENFHMDAYEKPNIMKQKNAFPPNFIHSLDSSHMMLTSLRCERAGITFVSVHDCYWTHPSTVHIMNKVCREQFVALHSEPILEDLSNFLTEKYSYHADEIQNDGSVMELTKRKLNRVLRKLPNTGDFNIDEVIESVYFFS